MNEVKRQAGILFPVFSLPGKYGIGCFSKEAREFADFLKRCGQSCWQILPVGPTGYGDSPYQSFSTFAGNPYFIDLTQLIEKGELTKEECRELEEEADDAYVDYALMYEKRIPLLKKAYQRSRFREDPAYETFCSENSYWLDDYCLFMAIKDAHGGAALSSWEEDIASYDPEAVKLWREKLQEEAGFYAYLQFTFDCQWQQLRSYVNG